MFATSGTSDHSPVVGYQRGGVNTSVTFRVKGGHDGLNYPELHLRHHVRPPVQRLPGVFSCLGDTPHRGISVRRARAH